MDQNQNLYETIAYKAFNLGIVRQEIPEYISNNLKYDFF